MNNIEKAEMDIKEPVWIVYDERAILGSTDDASVFVSYGAPRITTDEKAIREAKRDWRGHNFAVYRYDLNSKHEAENERLIYLRWKPRVTNGQ